MDEQTEKLLEAMKAQMEAQRVEIQALREQANEQLNGNFEDSLQKAYREFREENEHEISGLMSGPCRQCGDSWRDESGEVRRTHMPNTRGGHSYRSYETRSKPSEPGLYARVKDVKQVSIDAEAAMAEVMALAGEPQ